MTTYIKKIHIDKETKKNIILAAKNSSGPGHHLIELTDTLEISKFRLVHKKIKLITLEETGMSAKIEKTKKDGKLHYNILKVYK
ncbi:hypothetical protein N9R78_01040 [Pelagibacteraceae bacterium]|nr:hypothetical protein [Pelagibacteraceae bacterium]